MALLIGHGPFSSYCGEIKCETPIEIGMIIEKLAIPKELMDNLIIVKNTKATELTEFMSDEDTIHLFLSMLGG